MVSSAERVSRITELLEHILLALDSVHDLIKAQRVCRTWRDTVHASPALQRACWYRPCITTDLDEQHDENESRKLNPTLIRLGMAMTMELTARRGEYTRRHGASFDLTRRVNDKPGSWTTMLATQPPCRRIEIAFSGNRSPGDTLIFLVEAVTDWLLLGDIIAVLAEAQHRKEVGLDQDYGFIHRKARLCPVSKADDKYSKCQKVLDKEMAEWGDAINVVGMYPARARAWPVFSLQRIHPTTVTEIPPAGNKRFLLELEQWHLNFNRHQCAKKAQPMVRSGDPPYQANLVAVSDYQDNYFNTFKHIFRLTEDVK